MHWHHHGLLTKFSQSPPNVPSKMDHHNLPQTQKSPPNPAQRTRHHVNLPETASSPSRPVFFLDSLSSEAPGHQCPRFCCCPCWDMSPFCSPWGPQRWPVAPKDSGPGIRQGQVPRRPGPWGVMGCTCPCGWVHGKSPLNWLMSTTGEFFGMIAPGCMCVRLGALINFATSSSRYKPKECDVGKV